MQVVNRFHQQDFGDTIDKWFVDDWISRASVVSKHLPGLVEMIMHDGNLYQLTSIKG